jgi:hypothetical protein
VPKGGEKAFAADSPRIWGAGWRLGAMLRKARRGKNEPELKDTLEEDAERREKVSFKMDSADPCESARGVIAESVPKRTLRAGIIPRLDFAVER